MDLRDAGTEHLDAAAVATVAVVVVVVDEMGDPRSSSF